MPPIAASLAGTPDGASERAGVRFGKRAAHRIINLRADDGRYAPLEFTKPVGPGVWRPTGGTIGTVRPVLHDLDGRAGAAGAQRCGPVPPATSSGADVGQVRA